MNFLSALTLIDNTSLGKFLYFIRYVSAENQCDQAKGEGAATWSIRSFVLQLERWEFPQTKFFFFLFLRIMPVQPCKILITCICLTDEL